MLQASLMLMAFGFPLHREIVRGYRLLVWCGTMWCGIRCGVVRWGVVWCAVVWWGVGCVCVCVLTYYTFAFLLFSCPGDLEYSLLLPYLSSFRES